jgi:hypothetical protein
MAKPVTPWPPRFWRKVNKNGPIPQEKPELGPCWVWTARARGEGYGKFDTGKKHDFAHRLSYELLCGPIPEGLELDHLCRNRLCLNPKHLEPVTRRVNLLRSELTWTSKYAKRTHCNYGHPLSGENLRIIVKKSGHFARECKICRRHRNAVAGKKRPSRAKKKVTL